MGCGDRITEVLENMGILQLHYFNQEQIKAGIQAVSAELQKLIMKSSFSILDLGEVVEDGFAKFGIKASPAGINQAAQEIRKQQQASEES